MCVYDSWRVLIKVSHLPHNRTLSLCTCLLSYVHCGLSTSPAVRTQPQIRAVYLTTAASSPVYKHTQTSLLLFDFLLMSMQLEMLQTQTFRGEPLLFWPCAILSRVYETSQKPGDGCVYEGVRQHTKDLQEPAGALTQSGCVR